MHSVFEKKDLINPQKMVEWKPCKQAVKNGLRSARLMFCNFLCAHKLAMYKADHTSNVCSQTNSLKAFAVREN